VAPILPFTKPSPVELFAVEDTSAQITWRRLPDGDLTARIGDVEQVLGDAGRTGAAELTGLVPSTSHVVDLLVNGHVIAQPTVRTPATLGSRPLARIATISDLHLGEEGFGLVKRMTDRRVGSYPLRCARAAVSEALAWGAELVVIKGDITNRGLPDEWEMFDQLLAEIPVPVLAVPGNHDVVGTGQSIDATEALRSRGLFPAPVHTFELDGIRILMVDSTIPGRNWGRIGLWLDDLTAAVDTDRPVLIFTHHHLEEYVLPWLWPPGIRRHDGTPVLEQLLAVNPDIIFSSGHTHRNRIRQRGTALITEVSSTKDFPGVWAGYTVHGSGVHQSTRRVADPSCIEWTDRTHAVVAGIWGLWSPGALHDRSHTHRWSVDRAADPPREALAH